MADRWMDERDRQWRDRDWRRSENYGRGGEDYSDREDRSFQSYEDGGEQGGYGGDQRDYQGGYDRERHDDFSSRSRVASGGGAYGAGGGYGGGESYGRGAGGGRPSGYRAQPKRSPSFNQQDYTQGGRFYGDDQRQSVYREEYGQGSREYGDVPRGYDAGRFDQQRRPPTFGGGVGGYDYERGYGDAGRRDSHGGQERWSQSRDERGGSDQFEERAREAGQSLRNVGQKISSWFRGDRYMDDGPSNERRDFQEDFGRERRFEPETQSHRGRGPKNYRRSDERINEEAHDRLTDDHWLDASHIEIKVENGEVTLSGSVENRADKHRAEQLVENISGVSHVQNNLRVTQASGLTGSGRGFGSSALEAEMQRNEAATDPGNNGASGLSGRTSTGALAERSYGNATDNSIDPKSGEKPK
ncbi:BON domain-containing protein [Phenylobacterium deserti]|uniref:BON domain-containing protein n=1 Tax=Phenylobacterium deserti TaxID=1914756 RepID=A0A328A8R6_9CAUL|nr:BON domain-containing protein [Phenylobacterium deserti]RAK51043.1 hypothetical protein DJ018_17985 [Phenylobacterium deserti]